MEQHSRQIDYINRQSSNTYSARGSMDALGRFICPDGALRNFVISGGSMPEDRYQPMYQVLDTFVGEIPIIILHNHNMQMEAMACSAWNEYGVEMGPLWSVGTSNAVFEPFYGMSDLQVIATLRKLANRLEYSVSPRFERVIRAHLTILKELDIPVSLSGLYYLCQFHDMGEFHDNILALPCGEDNARRIWSDIGAENDDSQFDLFRTVISSLAHEAEHNGWDSDNSVSDCNCLTALKSQGTLLLSVDSMYIDLFLTYLAEELKAASPQQFLLILDGIKLYDDWFVDYLRTPGNGCSYGIITENVVNLAGDDDRFGRLVAGVECFVLFKHGTGKTATALSEVFGKFDYTKAETAEGFNKGFFKFLPENRHKDVRYSVENRFRVMPEDIIGLRPGQAIIFDTVSDQIIYYN